MPRLLLAPLALLLAATAASAQPPSAAERAQGYADRGDEVVFVFDPALHGMEPRGVAVTGPFRGWSSDDTAEGWAMSRDGDLWTLAVEAEAARLGPSTPFKFRADGRWLDPHADAPNQSGGNLVYRFGEVVPRLVAEVRGDDAVWVEVTGTPRPFRADAYRVVRWDGQPINVRTLNPHEARSGVLGTDPFDARQVHYVEVETEAGALRARARFDGLWRDLVTEADGLGARVEAPVEGGVAHTRFALFAPRAESVLLHLYETRTGAETGRRPLALGDDGVWRGRVPGDLHGTWYDFSVDGPDGPGSAFTNQTGETVSDPYARVSDDSWGRSRVWRDEFEPPAPVLGGRPAMEDVVAYEVHLQDFTDQLPLAEGVGPLEGFIEPGLTNALGEPVGIDYLDRLGVNVVHLLPVQEYLHYPDEAWQAAFGDDPFMIEQGVARENYQWGYRTTHAFAVESRFRSASDEPGRERERFRDLVDALHQRGMAVVVDVVFNHTGENMEGVEQLLTFNGIDKWYYYRLDDEGNHIGAFGNEVKSENRPMTQRWLLDQLRHFVEVFGVDGFRIDLAGQTDEQTLRWLQAELGEDVLIYGEPWIGSNDPDYEANPSWDWYKADSPITFFQDEARNAWKGSPLDDPTPAPVSRGFAGGDTAARDAALAGVVNDYAEEPTTTAGIGYLDIHDNWALADRFATCQTGDCRWDGREGVRAAEMRVAAALLLTSLGPVVMHGGTEIARSKGLAPLAETFGGEWERTEMSVAPIYIKGRGDTYNLRAANAFAWETVGNREGPVDHAAMHDWWRGLIALRLSEAGEVLRVEDAPDGWVRPILLDDAPGFLGYVVGETVLVMMNVGDAEVRVDAGLDGPWRLAARSDEAGGHVLSEFTSAPLGVQRLGPSSVRVWVRE